jgi:dUTP pyrophosphatase
MTIKIKKLHPEAKLPQYANPNDAGMDFYANETIIINPNDRKLISTGISLAIPHGYVGLIWDKSGIASKHGIKTMAGVVDSSYRGEIKVLLHNLSENNYVVEKGNKIAQMLIQPVEQRQIKEVETLEETERGSGGFGSTGIK